MGPGFFHRFPLAVDFFLPRFLPLYPQKGTGFVFSLGVWQSGGSQRPFPGTKPLGNDRSPQDFSRPGCMLKLRSTGAQIGQQLCIRIGGMFFPELFFSGFQCLCHHLPDGTFVNIMSSCVSHVSTFHTFVFFVCLETKSDFGCKVRLLPKSLLCISHRASLPTARVQRSCFHSHRSSDLCLRR